VGASVARWFAGVTGLVFLGQACTPAVSPLPPRAGGYAEDQVLRLAQAQEVRTLDPARLEQRAAIALAQNLFNGLTKFHEKTLLPQPDIAERWDVSPDGTVYTFRLRKDVSFWNGNPVTAGDFKYSWERVLGLRPPSANAFLFDAIQGAAELENDKTGKVRELSGVKAINDSTLQVTLTHPANYFLAQTALWVYAVVDARTITANPNWAEPPGQVVGTGPFRLTEWTKDRLTFGAVRGWWGSPKPRLRMVTVDVVPDPPGALQRYEAQSLDAVHGLNPRDLARVQREHRAELHLVPSMRTTWVGFNFTHPPFATSKTLRRAFCESIDKEQLARQVLGNGAVGIPARSLIPPGAPGALKGFPDPYPFNRAAARRLLADADPDGSRTRDLTYWTSDSPLNRRVADNLVAQWRQSLGIAVKIGVAPTGEFVRKRARHDYTLFRGSWGADYPHPHGWLWPVARTQQDQNAEGYSNPDLDRELAAAERMLDAGEAARKYQVVEKTYIQDLAACELYWSTERYLIKPNVRGYGGNAQLPFKWYNVSIMRP